MGGPVEVWTHLVDEVRVRAVYFNRMRREFGIQAQGTIQMERDEFGVDSPLWEDPI
jgi:hypothetical protein